LNFTAANKQSEVQLKLLPATHNMFISCWLRGSWPLLPVHGTTKS